jgi:hypothetical protein
MMNCYDVARVQELRNIFKYLPTTQIIEQLEGEPNWLADVCVAPQSSLQGCSDSRTPEDEMFRRVHSKLIFP